MDKLMIFVLLCCPLGFLKCNADDSEQERGYVFTIPYKLPMGGITTGCISLQNTEPPAYIVTELLHENKVISSASYNLTTGAKACLKLNVPMIHTPNAMVRLTIEFAKYPDYVVKDERNVGITQNSRFFLVHTDKGIYKPGEEVIIRIMQLHQDFTPVLEPVSHMYIKNPSNNIVMDWKKLSTKNGMRQMKFYLNNDAKLGRWYILTKLYPRNIDKYHLAHFEVKAESYRNFEIKVTPPQYILADAAKLTWKVCARYNYDMPARGTLVTKLSPYAANASKPYEEMVKKIELNSLDGCTEIVTSGAVLNLNRWSVLPKEMVLIANFTERETRMTQGEVSRSPIFYEAVKLKFAPTMAKYFKLDAPYEGKLLVLRPDNSPVPDEIIQLCLETSGKDAFIRHVHECRNFTSSSEGSVDFIIPPQRKNTTSLTIIATAVNYPAKHYFKDKHWNNFMNQPETKIRLYPVYSASGSYVVITGGKERPVCGKNYTFDVMYTLPEYTEYGDSIVFHYSVNSKSGILLDEQKIHRANVDTILDYSQFDNLLGGLKASVDRFYLNPVVHRFQISIKITPNMASMSELLVYYVRSDGEIVSASHLLEVGHCYNNDVRAEWNTTDVQEPGSPVKFSIKAAPDSLCGISLVKTPPPLLGLPYNLIDSAQAFANALEHNPFTIEGIMLQSGCKDIASEQGPSENQDKLVQYVNEMQPFNDFGVIVMTNMKQTTQSCSQSYTTKLSDPQAHLPEISYQKRVDEVSLLESQFPITWIWDLEPVKNMSNTTLEYTIPDNRAQWASHTACVSPTRGLGVSPIRVLQADRPFTYDYVVPPIAKVGEFIVVNATVHNNLNRTIPVTIDMNLDGFDVYRSELIKSFCIQPGKTAHYQYFIIPRNIGTFKTAGSAFINRDGVCDATNITDSRINITKPIKVLGEGFEVEQSTTALLCTVNATIDLKYTFNVSYPSGIIKDSEDTRLFLVGNVCGLTPDNLKKLVKIPTGCGEQNIAKFEPNIFVIAFVDTLKIKNVDIRKNAIKNLQQGYQTQLNYRLDDGSYSTFQNNPSSIWLTAFVLKAFALARKYIYISDTDLQQSADWIMEKQLPNGCFPMIGSLVHKDMKGGLEKDDSSAALTVFILISLLESKLEISNATINNAMSCIDRERGYLNRTLYTKVMTTYALTLMNHSSANASVMEMMKLAKHEREELWWVDTNTKTLSSSIEMTSYMILAIAQLCRNENMTDASKAVRWLLKHKNSVGGFVSTQDTALALHALTVYATLGGSKSVDLSIYVKAGKVEHAFKLKNDTIMEPLNVPLPEKPTKVDLLVHGYGCAVAQINVKYSIMPRESEFFDLSVTVRSTVPGNCDVLELKACARYKRSDGYTNMALMEVEMFTGYVPDRDSLEQLITSQKIKKYEIKDNELYLYFNKLDNTETCVTFKIRRQIIIINIKPAKVRVYDYYRPQLYAMALFSLNPECNNTIPLSRNTKVSMKVPVEDTSGSFFMQSAKLKNATTDVSSKNKTHVGDKTKKTTPVADCPVCINKLPSDITDVYCSAKSAIKVAIRKWRKVKTLMDLSPSRNMTRLRSTIEFSLNPGCTCLPLDDPHNMAIIINKNQDIVSTENSKQTLSNSYYIYVLPQIDDVPCEVVDARVTCFNEEEVQCT